MKRVNKSKNPTIQQMLSMASNLRKKFNKPSSVHVVAWDFMSKMLPNRMKYRVYVENSISMNFDSWNETMDYYFFIMRGDLNV